MNTRLKVSIKPKSVIPTILRGFVISCRQVGKSARDRKRFGCYYSVIGPGAKGIGAPSGITGTYTIKFVFQKLTLSLVGFYLHVNSEKMGIFSFSET